MDEAMMKNLDVSYDRIIRQIARMVEEAEKKLIRKN